MSLHIPCASGSINPFLQAVGHFLDEYSGWRRFLPWNRHRPHINEVATLVRDIRAGNVTLLDVFARLRIGDLAQHAPIQVYLTEIQAGLMTYLTQGQKSRFLDPYLQHGLMTPLMLSVSNPVEMHKFLDILRTLSQEQKYAILNAYSPDGYNIVMMAVKDFPDEILSLNTIINTLSPPQISDIFRQVTRGTCDNVFMLNVHPERIRPFLETIKRHVGEQDYYQIYIGALLLSFRQQAGRAMFFMEEIKNLNQAHRFIILNSRNERGDNVLMVVVRERQRKFIFSVFQMMGDMSEEQRYSLLKEPSRDYAAWNALMLASSNMDSDIIISLLNFIKGLTPDHQLRILNYRDRLHQKNSYEFMEQTHPQASVFALQIMNEAKSALQLPMSSILSSILPIQIPSIPGSILQTLELSRRCSDSSFFQPEQEPPAGDSCDDKIVAFCL